MAEWGKYLKNAVANVEQQLDKVLLENQTKTQSPRPSISPASSSGRRPARPDLQERLRKAASASKSPEKDVTPGAGDSLEPTPGAAESRSTQSPPATHTDSALKANETNTETPETAEAEAYEATGDGPESAASSSAPPEIFTTQELTMAPDLGPLLNQARKIALAHQSDDTLEFVDALEAFRAEFDSYEENVNLRAKSMNSKIAYLSAQRASISSGSEQQVALLLDEGQRLSQQELKLGLIIKKLRAERTASLSKETAAQTKDKENAKLRAEKTAIMNQLKEQEALVEHFRGMAESAASLHGPDSASSPTTDGNDGNGSGGYNHLVRRLESAESNHEVAKRTWHDLESSLLTRIAELELSAEARAASAAQLQDSLRDAQDNARETRNQMTSLQDELDASQEKWHALEKQYQAEIEELREQLKIKETEYAQNKQSQADAPHTAVNNTASAQPAAETNMQTPVSESQAPLDLVAPDQSLNPPDVIINANTDDGDNDSLEPMETFDRNEFAQSSEFLNGLNGPVGPAGPFGSLADDFDAERRPNLSRNDSRDGFEDSLSFMAPSASRRESSIVGSEAVHGSQLHIVKKLTLTVRRLENELFTVRKACELADHQREEAQTEVVRLVDAQDNLAALEKKYAELEATNNELSAQIARLEVAGTDKDERIDELEADVRDLKDMYREQIEALITEIEGLKK